MKAGQPIEKIGAKLFMLDLPAQIVICGRDNAHVHALRQGTAERIDFALFDQAQ